MPDITRRDLQRIESVLFLVERATAAADLGRRRGAGSLSQLPFEVERLADNRVEVHEVYRLVRFLMGLDDDHGKNQSEILEAVPTNTDTPKRPGRKPKEK